MDRNNFGKHVPTKCSRSTPLAKRLIQKNITSKKVFFLFVLFRGVPTKLLAIIVTKEESRGRRAKLGMCGMI